MYIFERSINIQKYTFIMLVNFITIFLPLVGFIYILFLGRFTGRVGTPLLGILVIFIS